MLGLEGLGNVLGLVVDAVGTSYGVFNRRVTC